MLNADMSLWAESNDESQNHDPTVDKYDDGFHNNDIEPYSRNSIQQNHKNQQYSGIGLVGNVVCCEILKFNNIDTDTDMSRHVHIFICDLRNFFMLLY